MKVFAIAFASVLLASPAFAQGVPVIGPALLNPNNVTNVPLIVSGAGSANFAAGITKLDVNEVRHIPAFNIPGGNAANLSNGINNFLIITKPAP